MAFWRLIELATPRMIRVLSAREASISMAEKRTSNKSIVAANRWVISFFFSIYQLEAQRESLATNSTSIGQQPVESWQPGPTFFTTYWKLGVQGLVDTQVIFDCTELWCQSPSSFVLQSDVYSHYKSQCTFKAMTDMVPHGPLTFFLRELFRLLGIIPLLFPDMALMTDKGFKVDNFVPGKLHRLAFHSNKEQMAAHDILETRSITRLGVVKG